MKLHFQRACWSKARGLSPTVQLDLHTKYPINEMIGLQGYLTVWTVPWLPLISARMFSKAYFRKLYFQASNTKIFRCSSNKIWLNSQTVSWSQVSSCSPTIQLDFNWTLEMSNQRNDRFARSSGNLNSSLRNKHCVKSVQIRCFFWSVFPCIRTEHGKMQTRKNSVFGQFLGSEWSVITKGFLQDNFFERKELFERK